MLHYTRLGKGHKKILFIHGNLASTHWWGPAMDRLADEFDMLAVDLPGYGQSAPCADAVSIKGHGAAVISLLSDLDFTPCTVVGHSLGGAVAMQIAFDIPDLLDALVLVDSAPVTGMGPFDYAMLEQVVANEDLLKLSLQATLAMNVPAALWETLLADCVASKASFIPNSRALTEMDFTKRARTFTKPVLVMQGEKDPVITAAVAAQTAAAYGQSQLTILPGSGHNPQVEVPDEFVQILRDFIMKISD
jgi:branched-chain amino acid transport system permease protein